LFEKWINEGGGGERVDFSLPTEGEIEFESELVRGFINTVIRKNLIFKLKITDWWKGFGDRISCFRIRIK
jgi:hypothetical protein